MMNSLSPKMKGYLNGLMSGILFGLIPLLSKPILTDRDSVYRMLFYRFFWSALVLGIVIKVFEHRSGRYVQSMRRENWLDMLVFSVLNCASTILFMMSLDLMPTGIAASMFFVYPVIVTILSALIFHQRPSIVVCFAIILALVGVALLGITGEGANTEVKGIGILVVVLAATAYACTILYLNRPSFRRLTGMQITYYSCILCALFLLCKCYLDHSLFNINSFNEVIRQFLLGVLATAGACVTLNYAVRTIGSVKTSILGAIEPVTALTLGVIFLGETLNQQSIFGVILILIAVFCVLWMDKIILKVGHWLDPQKRRLLKKASKNIQK